MSVTTNLKRYDSTWKYFSNADIRPLHGSIVRYAYADILAWLCLCGNVENDGVIINNPRNQEILLNT